MRRKAPQLAKLSRPRLHMAVARERLFKLIDAARHRPIVWLSGPPGSGKTTVVASYVQTHRAPCLWYQLDAGDADPSTFFYHLREAAPALSTARARRLPLLTPDYGSNLTAFGRHCFREFFRGAKQASLLVFDNYQEVSTSSALHEILDCAFREIPEGANVILISREPPPKAFARAIVNNTVASIGWEDLQLTLDETVKIAAARSHRDGSVVQALHQVSNGWAAGVTLMLEQLHRGGVLGDAATQGQNEPVFDYFATQIFETAPEETRRLLLKTALFPSFSVALAREISGSENAAKIIELLHRKRLFIDRRQGKEYTYQYHAMFRTFLQSRAASELSDKEIRSLTSRAARLLVKHGNEEAAFTLYCHAGGWKAASVLLVRMAPILIGQGRWQTVTEWANRLPQALQAKSPWIDYWVGMALEPVKPIEAREHLKRAFKTFQSRSDHAGQMMSAAGIIDTIYTEFVSFVEMDSWIVVLATFLSNDPRFPSLEAELRTRLSFLVVVYYQPGHRLLKECASCVEALLKAPFDVNLKVMAGERLAAYADAATDLELFRRLAAEVDPLLNSTELSPANAARYLFMKGYNHYIAWQMAQALFCLERAKTIARREGLGEEEFKVNVYLVMCARRAQKMPLAERALAELETMPKPSRGPILAIHEHVKALMAYTRGNVQLAIENERTALQLLEGTGYVYAETVFMAFNAMYLIAAGNLDAAAPYLTKARKLSAGTAIDAAQAYIALHEANIAHLRGDHKVRNELLRETLAYGRTAGGIARLRWAPKAMSVLFPVALQENIEPELVRFLISELEVDPEPAYVANWPWAIKIHTLGAFELTRDGEPIKFSRKAPKRVLALLKAIVALGGINVSRQRLIDFYAGNDDGDKANNSFEVAVARLRHLLGSREAVLIKGDSVSLNPRLCWVDTWAFEQLLKTWSSRIPADIGDLSEYAARALKLYRGNFLPGDMDEPWSIQIRSRLRTAFVSHLTELGSELERENRWDDAIRCYQRGLDVDDLAESLYQGLIRCFSAIQQPADAIAVFRRLRQTFSVVLGLAPSHESEVLVSSLRS